MKKGDLSWDTIGKLILVVAFLLIFVLIIFLLKDKLYNLYDGFRSFLGLG